MKEKSSTEKALDYMQEIYDREPHYFQIKSNRKTARQGFIDTYNLDQKKGSDIFNHSFPKFLRKNKLNKKEFLETRFAKPKNSDIKATIKPKPQSFAFEKSPVEAVNEEISNQQNSSIPSQIQIKNVEIESKDVETILEGFLVILKFWLPLDDLTKEERESLGKIWLPFFRRYFSNHWALIGLPFIATLGIFGKHIIKARKIKKENKLKAIEEQKEVSS